MSQGIRQDYQASLRGWQEEMNSVKEWYKKTIEQSWQQAKYVVRNVPFAPDKLVVCPPHSAMNMAPNQQHRVDYATGIFEGSSAEPVCDDEGNIVGINVVLLKPRMERFERSMVARGFGLEVSLVDFSQALLDLVAIHGLDLVTQDDGLPTRAYLRPSAGPGVGPWGISLKKNHFIEASHTVFRWGPYFPDSQRVNEEEGVRAMITGAKRDFKILGKHASNYGVAALDGALARKMNYDELLYLAPYGIKDGNLNYDILDLESLQRWGVLADGPGEEVFGVLADGQTLVYPPMRVNRLGGTVLQYVVDHMAPALGLETKEQDISLSDLRTGKVVGLGFAGNAARVTPIGQVDIVESDLEGGGGRVVETVFEGGIHETVARLHKQWEAEMRGLVDPSHPSLLTPVDLKWGSDYRSQLDDFWGKLGLL